MRDYDEPQMVNIQKIRDLKKEVADFYKELETEGSERSSSKLEQEPLENIDYTKYFEAVDEFGGKKSSKKSSNTAISIE